MEETILIPKSQYLKMLETYDQTIKEPEENQKGPHRSSNFYKGKVTRQLNK